MLIDRVAQLYYVHSLTHQEIADALDLSRIRVTRLLAEARATGIVEIIVHTSERTFPDEERALIARYALKRVWIAPNVPDQAKTDRAFAEVGAEAFKHVFNDDSNIAVGVSTTIAAIANNLPKTPCAANYRPVGGSSAGLSTGSNSHEVALQLAAQTGGKAFHIPAPLLAASVEAQRLSIADPGVSRALDSAASADTLIAGIGGLASGILLDSLTPELRAELLNSGAVGDVGGRYFDADGVAVETTTDARIVGLDLKQIRAIPQRLIAARGKDKVESLTVGLETGLINMLVTDLDTANSLLARP